MICTVVLLAALAQAPPAPVPEERGSLAWTVSSTASASLVGTSAGSSPGRWS